MTIRNCSQPRGSDQCGLSSNFANRVEVLTQACCERTNICRRGTNSFRWLARPVTRMPHPGAL